MHVLIENGADVNLADDFKVTPLHMAVDFGHGPAVNVLLRAGANVNALTKFRRSPLQFDVFGCIWRKVVQSESEEEEVEYEYDYTYDYTYD
jgi:ankyrin repeat protein